MTLALVEVEKNIRSVAESKKIIHKIEYEY